MPAKLGDKARDRITGFEGTVISEHRYLNGCLRLTLQPNELRDGKPIECQVFDIEQIDVVLPNQHSVLNPTGGPETTPSRTAVPSR